MVDSRRKTLSYHRAQFYIENPASVNFVMCLKQATDKCQSANSRTVTRGNGQVIRLAYLQKDEQNGYFIHLTADTPGEYASVVPKATDDASEISVNIIPPPNDAEFMDGDAFIYAKGNDICLCATTIRTGSIKFFFREFFDSAKIRKDAGQFDFLNAVDAHKIALLQKRGIKEIELKASLYKATMDYAKRKDKLSGVLEKVSRHFKILFGSEHDFTDDALQVKIILKVDRRHAGGITLGERKLEQVAIDILNNEEDSDDYVITLKDGGIIKPGEILLRSVVDVISMGKSVDRNEVMVALISYYKRLAEEGRLVQ